MTSNIIYIGVKGSVVAVEKERGSTLWQTKLKGGLTGGDRFVTLLVEERRVYAHTHGELFCLDAQTGQILWRNALDGLGYDLVSLAIEGTSNPSASTLAQHRKKQSSDGNDGGASH